MMGDLVRRPFAIHHNYTNPITRQRAQGLLVMNLAAFVFVIVFIGVRVITVLSSPQPTNYPFAPEIIVGLILLIVTYLLIQMGRLNSAIWLFLGVMLVPLVVTTAAAVDPAAPVALVLPLVAAGILLGRRGMLVIVAVIALSMILRAIDQSHSLTPITYIPANNVASELLSYAIFFGLPAIFLLVFSGSNERAVEASVVDVQRLQVTTRFTERLQGIETEPAVLVRALEVIQADLGFDLAQFYLRDESDHYTRRVRLGFGQLESGVRVALRPSDETVIAEAVSTRQPVLVTYNDPGVLTEHLVAPARQSVTLALVYNNAVLAVLDVQSEHREIFSEIGIAALQNMTMQTARELAQVRRINELENNVRDQENIINRFLNQMTELQQRTQNVSGTSWARYLQGRAQGGFGFNYDGGVLVSATDLPDAIREAVQQGDIYVESKNGSQVINVPISLRNQILGALTLTIPGERAINERQIEMLRTIASRLGIALESNRLLEQTQAQAQRERKASDISGLLLSVTEVDDMLHLAASNFNEALGAVHTRIYIEPGALTASGEQS